MANRKKPAPRKRYPSRISVEEIMEDMGLGRDRIYDMLKRGVIPNIKIGNGRNYYIPRHAFEEWKKTFGAS